MNPLRVWDPLVRVLHWGLVAAIATAWFAGEESLRTHEWAGWAALAIVGVRVAWGFAGSHHARFAQFIHGPRGVGVYARDVLAHSEARYLGHNPLGGWMVLVLLLTVALTSLTGWLYTSDMLWGLAWMERLHTALAWALLALAALHVGGVVFTGLRHGENLVAAMLTGRKRPPAPGDQD
ncbi:MAG: cytochrome b/b6 domain-containing protein [Burkholderiales bacterium]|nr:cytochrome b/b6 domain-containing protein [Burkholderiales bacterium]